MNNKKQTKQPLFAEVNLAGDEFRQPPSTHMQRTLDVQGSELCHPSLRRIDSLS